MPKIIFLKIVNTFYSSIEAERHLIQDGIKSLAQESSPILSSYWNTIFATPGKLIRSAFLLYITKIIGKVNPEVIQCGMVIELIHQASLIHDDVVDQSNTRRGAKSTNAIWGNSVAVLIGDQLFTFAMDTAIETPKAAQKTITKACRLVTEAEILQHKNNLSDSHENYYKIIEGKTGALFAAACSMAAICANQSSEDIEDWWQFGLVCGTIFQIRDDIMDFLPESFTGKPAFMDISNQKLTLPILEMLSLLLPEDRHHFLNRIKDFSETDNEWLLETLQQTQAMQNAQRKISDLSQTAIIFLKKYPQNEANQDLQKLIQHLSQPVF